MLNNYSLSDPEFFERARHFAFDEVVNDEAQKLPDDTRYLAVLAALMGCQGTDVFRQILPEALDGGLSPVAVKEMVYQAVDYLGLGRALPFLDITNDILRARGVALPLAGYHDYERPP